MKRVNTLCNDKKAIRERVRHIVNSVTCAAVKMNHDMVVLIKMYIGARAVTSGGAKGALPPPP